MSYHITLDEVMQAPGRADGDTSDGFKYGGWSAPYFYKADEAAVEFMVKYIKPADLLLDRKTFESFASFWPTHGDLWPGVDDIKKLKDSEGSDIQVHGNGDLNQTLLKHDLVDELWLKTFPIMLGQGKKL